MKRGWVMSRRHKMRDGNVSLRWNKWNYQLVPEISLLLIIFVQFSERTCPCFICCLDDFHHCEGKWSLSVSSKMSSDRLACRPKADLKYLWNHCTVNFVYQKYPWLLFLHSKWNPPSQRLSSKDSKDWLRDLWRNLKAGQSVAVGRISLFRSSLRFASSARTKC